MNWDEINPAITSLNSDFLRKHTIQLDVLRLDQIHPVISGNKWFKLKYNVKEYLKGNYAGMISFGGAFSNHLAAYSYLTPLLNIPTVAVIRGEDGEKKPTPTLTFLNQNGTQIVYTSRSNYKLKNTPGFLNDLKNKFPGYYVIPEGGSNELGVKGCADISKYIKSTYDMLAVSVGTASTLKGLMLSKQNNINQYLGFTSLRGEDLITPDISSFCLNNNIQTQFQIINRFHFGGFGKSNSLLNEFMLNFKNTYQFELDVVYTSKMFFGLFNMIENKEIPIGSKILAIHTGGLQGNASVVY